MRIAIREQLVALVVFVGLVALAVVSISTWTTNHAFVLSIRASRLSLTASVKASQIASALALMTNIVRSTSTRIRLQTYLSEYAQGNVSASVESDATVDLEAALPTFDSDSLGVQACVYYPDPTGSVVPILNVSISEFRDLPPSLYPNFTNVNGTPYYQQTPLSAGFSLLLGPQVINSTFSLVSITLPVINLTDSTHQDVLGYVTVAMSASSLYKVMNSLEGLGNTGTTLIVGPDNMDNRFPSNIPFGPDIGNLSQVQLGQIPVSYVFPPEEDHYATKRHPNRDYGTDYKESFRIDSYPALIRALVFNQNSYNNAGSWLATTNEQGYKVGVGYALPSTDLVNWVVLVEWSHAEIWQPITHLRNILLACVFGTTGGLLLFAWPVAHLSIRPIRRLREATLHTVMDPDDDDDTGEKHLRSSISVVDVASSDELSSQPNIRRKHSKGSLIEQIKYLLGKNPPARPTSQGATFRIPSKVKQRKHWVQDELTELTTTFNEMTDELLLQYERLEERVRRRTAELELSKQAAEAANESKTLFIANVSHELKTPLNGILGMCAVCMQETDMGRIKQSLSTMYNSGDLLLTLLTDLLTFSKHQAGQALTLENKVFRLHDLSTQLKAIFENQAKLSQIGFEVVYEGKFDAQGILDDASILPRKFGPPGTGKVKHMKCRGDMHRILQVVINLLSNALKFTPANGSVKLTVRCCASSMAVPPSRKSSQQSSASKMLLPQLKMLTSRRGSLTDLARGSKQRSRQDTDSLAETTRSGSSQVGTGVEAAQPPPEIFWFEFEVNDTGPGIAKHLQAQIFEPFVQGDLRLTKMYGGTGLGLSICSQLAKLMNGTIIVDSELGHGSTFKLRIPLEYLGISSHVATVNQSTETDLQRTGTYNDYDLQNTTGDEMETPTPDETIRRASAVLSLEGQPRLIGLSEPFFGTNTPPSHSDSEEARRKDSKLTVLVAEDNKVNQEVVLRMLKLEDVFNVEIARDGQEALDKVKDSIARNKPYDLVLMDVQMPVLDGRQSTRLIREFGFTSPIVALSAFSDESNQQACIESGMDYFLAKPIKRPALRRVLKTYCPTIHEQDESDHASPKSKPLNSPRRPSVPATLDLLEEAMDPIDPCEGPKRR